MLSLLLWLLPLAQALPQSSSSEASYPLPIVPAPGLPDNSTGIRVHGIAVGALPDWSHENPRDINVALGKLRAPLPRGSSSDGDGPAGASASLVGDYLNVSPDDYSFSQVDYHLDSVSRLARESARPVYAPALLYGASIDTWTPEMTDALATAMLKINQRGVTVWLRFCFEMNGAWMPYGAKDAEGYKRVWIEVTNAIRAKTGSVSLAFATDSHSVGAQRRNSVESVSLRR